MTTALESRFWSKVDDSDTDGCWLWTGRRVASGHGQMTIRHGHNRGAHRVAWELTRGPIPEGLLVCHHCDNPPCVRPSHLFVGTYADNAADMVAKGRSTRGRPRPSKRGSGNHRAKLTPELAAEIRGLYRVGYSQDRLAARFGVSQSTISTVVRQVAWPEVELRLAWGDR